MIEYEVRGFIVATISATDEESAKDIFKDALESGNFNEDNIYTLTVIPNYS